MNWINWVNSGSCIVLMLFLVVAAHETVRWKHRLACWLVSASVGLQAIDPMVEWVPDMAWPSALMNAVLAAAVWLLRKPLSKVLVEATA
jgi:hypothetical protein